MRSEFSLEQVVIVSCVVGILVFAAGVLLGVRAQGYFTQHLDAQCLKAIEKVGAELSEDHRAQLSTSALGAQDDK